MITLVSNGSVYAPEPLGRADVLILGERIAKVGAVDRRAAEALGVDVEVVDASGCLVAPGLIDPHEHLLGGSGEEGFSTQTPEVTLTEIVTGGITTVVGCLGVDTTTKTMPGLLAKAKGLREEGLGAYVWTGGYPVPPATVTGSIREDLMYIDEVIGAGEVAISDHRSTHPTLDELARLVADAHVGGLLSGKAGVTHFHVGNGERRLELIRRLLDEKEVEPDWLYLTHVERKQGLMEEAVEISRRGVFVDVDTVEEDLAEWLRFYVDRGGDPARLTVSSDAGISSPSTPFRQLRGCVLEHGFALEEVLPLMTSNTARALRLDDRGRLAPGMLADVLVLREGALEIEAVLARGRVMVRDGRPAVSERFLKRSNRNITLRGGKA
jgi:beta-aspartyl-dipeptidase (metallo-type)